MQPLPVTPETAIRKVVTCTLTSTAGRIRYVSLVNQSHFCCAILLLPHVSAGAYIPPPPLSLAHREMNT